MNNAAPGYPAESARLGEVGRIVVRVLTRDDGSVERVVVQRSSGHLRLDESALDAVKTWRFPAGPKWVLVPVKFGMT